jgi:predicted alpha/beta superfamily hydrolase
MKTLALLLCGAALIAPAARALAADPAPPPGYVLPETQWWDIQAAHGETYRIYISMPAGEPPKGGYPVLYVLDGNAMFAGFAEARRIQGVYPGGASGMIVVGVGYPGGQLYERRRVGDFTPPISSSALAEYHRKDPQGGRPRFEAFLIDQLRPEIARRYPVNTARESLFGHSLGGLFALHVLYSRPEAFHTITAASPTLWWDDQMILAEEAAFRKRLASDAPPKRVPRLQLLVGENEEAPVTVVDVSALAARLEPLSGSGLRSRFELLAAEGHLTAPHRAITPTLRWSMQFP